MELQDR